MLLLADATFSPNLTNYYCRVGADFYLNRRLADTRHSFSSLCVLICCRQRLYHPVGMHFLFNHLQSTVIAFRTDTNNKGNPSSFPRTNPYSYYSDWKVRGLSVVARLLGPSELIQCKYSLAACELTMQKVFFFFWRTS